MQLRVCTVCTCTCSVSNLQESTRVSVAGLRKILLNWNAACVSVSRCVYTCTLCIYNGKDWSLTCKSIMLVDGLLATCTESNVNCRKRMCTSMLLKTCTLHLGKSVEATKTVLSLLVCVYAR